VLLGCDGDVREEEVNAEEERGGVEDADASFLLHAGNQKRPKDRVGSPFSTRRRRASRGESRG
jgi:hypothetical protein